MKAYFEVFKKHVHEAETLIWMMGEKREVEMCEIFQHIACDIIGYVSGQA